MPPVGIEKIPPHIEYRAGEGARPAPRRNRERNAASVLTDQFPGFKSLPCGFTQISIVNPTITAGESAWLGLGRWKVQGDGPFDPKQEIGIYAVTLELGPTDNASAADISWGTTLGLGGAIVIGTNLPFGTVGGVSSSPAYVPGVEASGQGILLSQRHSPYIFSTGFPSGKLTDTVPAKTWLRVSFAPYIYRVARGTTIDVALVIRRAQITGQTGNINGLARVAIDVGLPEHEIAWAE